MKTCNGHDIKAKLFILKVHEIANQSNGKLMVWEADAMAS